MGIVNVTPDSFSDGGCFATAEAAWARGMALVAEGADVVDVGGESTRPGAAPVGLAEEMRRVLPVVERLAAAGVAVSVDTMKPEVMRAAAAAGAAVLNDVNGFCADGAVEAAVESGCGLVVMHKRGAPRTMQAETPVYDDVVREVGDFLAARVRRLVAAGVDACRVMVDPGVGFGKTRAHNVALLNGVRALALAARAPVLVGVSRKSLFGEVAGGGAEEEGARGRDAASAVAAAWLAARGAAALRVHNVRMTRQALAVRCLLEGEGAAA